MVSSKDLLKAFLLGSKLPSTPLDKQIHHDPTFLERFAIIVSWAAGSVKAFLVALAVVIIWLISGPVFDYSSTWQLMINTGTTIITFLMVFLLQHAQAQDTRAIHAKLDELIRSNKEADNHLIGLENPLVDCEEEIEEISKEVSHIEEELEK